MNSFTEHARESKVAEECVTKYFIELPACQNCTQIQPTQPDPDPANPEIEKKCEKVG